MTLTTWDCNKQQIELSMQNVSEEKLHRPGKSSQHCGNKNAISDGCGAGAHSQHCESTSATSGQDGGVDYRVMRWGIVPLN